MKLHVTAPAIALALCFALAPAGVPGVMAADPFTTQDEIVGQMIELNKKGLAAYRAGQAAAAMADLQAAEKLSRDHNLGTHAMTARTQIHLGIVAIAGLKNRSVGLEHFARALAIQPRIKLTPSLASRPLKRDLRLARKIKLPPAPAPAVVAAPAPAPAPAPAGKANEAGAAVAEVKAEPQAQAKAEAKNDPNEPPLPSAVPQPLYCPTPDLGPPGEAVPLFCLTQPEIQVGKVVAYFRPSGGENYTPMPMNRSKTGWLSAKVPAQSVKGRSLQVYFEAQDGAGKLAANNGKDEMPHVIQLKAGADKIKPRSLALIEVGAPPPAEERGAESTPLELRAIADEKAALEGPPKNSPRRAPGKIWVGFGAGTGYGWHRELPLERHRGRQVTEGFSPAGLGFISPELGYQLSPAIALSLQTRHQYLPAAGSGDAEVTGAPPQMAHAVLARLQCALFSMGDLQAMGSLAAGGGSALRMNIAPNKKSGLAASDTVVSGPFAGGAGLGLAYNLNEHFIVVAEARGLAGLPNFGVMLEGSAGLQVAF